jgi:hypothetical protein
MSFPLSNNFFSARNVEQIGMLNINFLKNDFLIKPMQDFLVAKIADVL